MRPSPPGAFRPTPRDSSLVCSPALDCGPARKGSTEHRNNYSHVSIYDVVL